MKIPKKSARNRNEQRDIGISSSIDGVCSSVLVYIWKLCFWTAETFTKAQGFCNSRHRRRPVGVTVELSSTLEISNSLHDLLSRFGALFFFPARRILFQAKDGAGNTTDIIFSAKSKSAIIIIIIIIITIGLSSCM